MKTTKDTIFEYIQKESLTNELYTKQGGLRTQEIAEYFHLQRTNTSTLLNALVKEGKLKKSTKRPVVYSIVVNEDPIHNMDHVALVGSEGSLSHPLQIAKAAILYPQRKLNLLVTGKPGTGVSHFARFLFNFGLMSNVFRKKELFFTINCFHFLENLNEINTFLFREHDLIDSLFYKAKGGMLVINNADLLTPQQRALLIGYLQSGNIYNRDHSEMFSIQDVFVVLSCNPSNADLFRNVLPMVAKLPELNKRPLKEKYELINIFFANEAKNADRNIQVNREVISALLAAEFPYNVKELQMEILKACATASVRVMDRFDENVEVTLQDFGVPIQKSGMHIRSDSSIAKEIYEIVVEQVMFIYDKDSSFPLPRVAENQELYTDLKKRYGELSKRGVTEETIHHLVDDHIDFLYRHYNYYQSHNETYDTEQLSRIVKVELIEMVKKFLDVSEKELHKSFKTQVFYGLCLHMNSLLTLKFDHQRIERGKPAEIINQYPKEYALSTQFTQEFQKQFHVELPIEEISIITLFLVNDPDDVQSTPKLLYVFHGNGVASGLREVTNSLTHTYNTYAYDLTLEKDNAVALKELESLIQNIDDGSGVIVIYDMGSIKAMLEEISERNNIKIRDLYMPVTLVGLEIARKCIMGNDIESIYHSTLRGIQNVLHPDVFRKSVILTLCHTGEGGAVQLKQYIDQYSNLGIKTIPLSISNREELIEQVGNIKKIYHIHCFAGTYDPCLMGIPFISMADIFANKPEDLDNILSFIPIQSKYVNYDEVYEYFESQFHHISVNKIKMYIPPVMDKLSNIYALNKDEELGLFVHIASMIENIKSGNPLHEEPEWESILDQNKEDFDIVYRILKPLEKKFEIIIPNSQISIIIQIAKHI